jgi:hypothetical protein
MGRGCATLNDIGASGEPQQRRGEPVPTFLARREGGTGAKRVAEEEEPTDTVGGGPRAPLRTKGSSTPSPQSSGLSDSHALLLAMLLGAAIFVSLYVRR